MNSPSRQIHSVSVNVYIGPPRPATPPPGRPATRYDLPPAEYSIRRQFPDGDRQGVRWLTGWGLPGVRCGMDFTGRAAIITGASRGLGCAAAARLYERGASVAVNARDEARANRLAGAL